MKIPLNLQTNGAPSAESTHAKLLEHDIAAAQKGDWNAKNSIARSFMPLLTSLAEKRSTDVAKVNEYIEAGKAGLFAAVKKHKPGAADNFQIFAVDFIENSMDNLGKEGGFLSRLFGRK